MSNRGQVTPAIKELAKKLLDIEDISTDELRLMPYIQYVMINEQKLQPQLMNPSDRKIFARWKANGWVDGGMTGLRITKDFWDAITEIIWVSYVAYRETEDG